MLLIPKRFLILLIIILIGLIFYSRSGAGLIADVTGQGEKSTETSSKSSNKSPRDEAVNIMNVCSGGNPYGEESCYANEFKKFAKNNEYSHSVAIMLELQKLVPTTRGCHLTAHFISIAEVEKDPENWKEILTKVDPNLCSGGFVHGVLEAHTRYDNSFVLNSKSIDDICRFVSENFGKRGDTNCSHIMGHLVLAQELGDIEKSVKMCDKIKESLQFECYSGVFMENETRDNLAVHTDLKKIPWDHSTHVSLENICSKYTLGALIACWREIVHVSVVVARGNPEIVFELCNKSPDRKSAIECYFHGIGIIAVSSMTTDRQLENLCVPLIGADEYTKCVSRPITSLIASSSEFSDRAMVVCNSYAPEYTRICYSSLGAFTKSTYGEKKKDEICSKIPSEYLVDCRDSKTLF